MFPGVVTLKNTMWNHLDLRGRRERTWVLSQKTALETPGFISRQCLAGCSEYWWLVSNFQGKITRTMHY